MLPLTEIKQTWAVSSSGEGVDEVRDEDEDEDEGEVDGEYTLHGLVAGETDLVRWIDHTTGRTEEIFLDVHETELCTETAERGPAPYRQEYEDYMGNYGNTLDRWCRRAALVVFPADQQFATWAEVSPDRAMERLGQRALPGDLAGARRDCRSARAVLGGDDQAPGPGTGLARPGASDLERRGPRRRRGTVPGTLPR